MSQCSFPKKLKFHHFIIVYLWHSNFRSSLVRVFEIRADESFHKHFTMQLFTNQNSILSFFSIFGTFRGSLDQVFKLDIHEAVYKHFTMQLFTSQNSVLSFFSIFGTFRYSLVYFWDTLKLDESFHEHYSVQLFTNQKSIYLGTLNHILFLPLLRQILVHRIKHF